MKKILLRVFFVLILIIVGFVCIVCFPSLHYKYATHLGKVTIYHQKPLEKDYEKVINEGLEQVRKAEIYNQSFDLDICLNDGSRYPKIVERFKGPAFGYGFYNKVVLNCDIDFEKDKAYWNGRTWLLSNLLAHEMIHCFQYDAYGFFTLRFPFWKLEGYPEYVVYHPSDETELRRLIAILLEEEEKGINNWSWVNFDDGVGAPAIYFKDRLLIEYLMTVEKMTYRAILNDTRTREMVIKEMKAWYEW